MPLDTANFITAYPGLTYSFIGALFLFLGALVSIVVRQTVNQFKSSVEKVDQILTKLFSKYEDLEHRLTTQETICETCRLSCPERKK